MALEPKEKKQAASTEVPKSPAEGDEIRDVKTLGEERSVTAWEVAGMMAAAGWAEGKQVTAGQFKTALALFRKRGQGTGKIKL